MLILSRKEGEGITLVLPDGDTVQIMLTEYNGQQTKVGIDAPQNIKIWRNELMQEPL